MKLNPFKNSDCYVTDEVSSIPTELANLCQETREKFVTDLAAVSRGKDESKNPKARFKALLKEAAPNDIYEGEETRGMASRPLEFLPVIIEALDYVREDGDISFYFVDESEREGNFDEEVNEYVCDIGELSNSRFINDVLRFSYTEYDSFYGRYVIYTNFRTLYNAGFAAENIPFLQRIWYKVFKSNGVDYISIGGEAIPKDEISKKYFYPTNRLSVDALDYIPLKAQEMLQDGIDYKTIIQDFKDGNCEVFNSYTYFKAIKLQIPMLIWAQWPMTHTQLSKESQSDRVAEGNGYWLPDDIIEKINSVTSYDIQKLECGELMNELLDLQLITRDATITDKSKFLVITECFLKLIPQHIVQRFLELCGYKREIWSRAPYYFKLKEVVVTGWANDPTTWSHSFLERSVIPELWKNWTQKETKQVMECVRYIVMGGEHEE